MRRLPRLVGALVMVLAAGGAGQLGDLELTGTRTVAAAVALPTTSTTTTAMAAKVALPTPAPLPADPYPDVPYRTVGTIEIPKLGLRAPIGEGVSLTIIDRGPAHWPGTAMPGRPGNVVIAGHRVTNTAPFRRIAELRRGDRVIFFDVDGRRWVYAMTGAEVVAPSRVDIVRQTPAPTATLFACHPPHSARSRYVVHLALAS